MKRKLLALFLGLGAATALVAFEEKQARAAEKGRFVVVTDPPGIKYALSGVDPKDRGRGWREGVTPPVKESWNRNVLCIGDSVTFGVNVSPMEAWPGVLEKGVGGKGVKVYNFGVAGWDMEQVATLAETRLSAWKPDVVVWAAYINDLIPTYMVYGATTGNGVFVGTSIPQNARVLPEKLSLLLVQNFALFRRFQASLFARGARDKDALIPYEGWYEGHLDRLLSWANTTKTPLVVLAVPPHVLANPSDCESEVTDPAFCATSKEAYLKMTAAFSVRGIAWIDGLAVFQQSGQSAFFPASERDPDHPNPEGQKLLAEAVTLPVKTILDSLAPSTDTSQWRRHPPTRQAPQ